MRYSTTLKILSVAILAMTATSCYTQLKTTYDPYYSGGSYHSGTTDRASSGDRSLEERGEQVVNEEDYTLGYEDGWEDAEAYYFKDYEAQRWYEQYGATLARDPYARRVIVNNYYGLNGYYSPYYSHYYPHYNPYSYWASRWNFSVGFGFGWGNFYPHNYGYYSYYSPYAYPGYYPYYGYGGYWGWGGYGNPYYGGIVVVKNGSKGRHYGPRNTGLISRGSGTIRRTRDDARVRNTADRRTVRSEARSNQVSRSRGTVNRSTDSRSRSSSTVRSRSGNSSNSRGTVNRGSSSNRSRGSSGTVNRGSSNSSRSNGTVNRSRSSSSSRSNGTVNRSRSSSRDNGTVNRGRSSNNSRSGNISNDGVVISRGTSIIRHRESDDNRRSSIDRRTESDPYTRVNRSSTVNNRVKQYNDSRSGVSTQRPMSRRERSIESLRSQLLDREEVEAPARFNNSRSSTRSNGTSFFNNSAVRQIYKHVIGNSRSNSNRSRSSSVGRSSSSSNGRSSSVSRSRSSSNSSRSTVRSSRSSSSSKGRSSSSSRSRSSSSRDRDR